MQEQVVDYYRCPDALTHDWTYRRKKVDRNGSTYLCTRCALIVTKTDLKENIDA